MSTEILSLGNGTLHVVHVPTVTCGEGGPQFPDDLLLKYLDGRRWEIFRDFTYITAAGETIVVPAGFITDLASIPRFLWPFLPPNGEYGPAAVVHDWLYRLMRHGLYDRAVADGVFLEAMLYLGIPRWKARAFYRAVRWLFPLSAWWDKLFDKAENTDYDTNTLTMEEYDAETTHCSNAVLERGQRTDGNLGQSLCHHAS